MSCRGRDVHIENVYLRNVTKGIYLGANGVTSVGRNRLNGIYGQPMTIGVSFDNCLDVCRLDEVHFWPYWSTDPDVTNWVKNNGTGIVSARNDNPMFSQIFCLGYRRGFLFTESAAGILGGVTSKFKIVNCDLDYCQTGIEIDGPNTTGQISNLSVQGGDATNPGINGVYAKRSGRIQIVNADLKWFTTNAIRVESGDLLIDGVIIEQWNRSGSGFPAIEKTATGGTVIVGRTRMFFGPGTQMSGVTPDN